MEGMYIPRLDMNEGLMTILSLEKWGIPFKINMVLGYFL